ncbi:hypothetical protein ACRAWF_44545 [Streptomyces sp. L7]
MQLEYLGPCSGQTRSPSLIVVYIPIYLNLHAALINVDPVEAAEVAWSRKPFIRQIVIPGALPGCSPRRFLAGLVLGEISATSELPHDVPGQGHGRSRSSAC